MTTLKDVIDKLSAQGSPNQLALFFEQEKIHGLAGCTADCPIARYAERELGEEVYVDGLRACLGRHAGTGETEERTRHQAAGQPDRVRG